MKIVVGIYSPFVAWRIPEAQVEWLRREFPEHTFVRVDDDEAMEEAIVDAEVAFSSLVRASHFAAARVLRWIHSPAAGVGAMLFPAMVASPIVLTNSRGNSAVSIAEHVIAVTLALFRRLPLASVRQRERVWAQDELTLDPPIRTLRGARVLVVGLGAIGAETARLALAFGADVAAIRRHPDSPRDVTVAEVVAPERLHDQLPRADVVVVAAPQTAETRHLIGAPELARMKEDAVLVNISRGRLVDEAALAAALDRGRLRGAALDVFEEEPLPGDSPLWQHPRVIVTPHISGLHARYWPDAAALFAENLRRFMSGRPLVNLVDKRAGY
jgi:phosphoglycerate dehydrogenase-like enzyme